MGIKEVRTELLVPHEQISYYRLTELLPDIARNGINIPIAVTEYQGKYIILDGHHRWHIAKLLKLPYVPVAIFDYFHEDLVVLDYKTREPLNKKQLLEKIVNGYIFPPKSTYHAIRYNGELVHISSFLEMLLNRILS